MPVLRRTMLATATRFTLGACATAWLRQPIFTLAQSADVSGQPFTNSVGFRVLMEQQ